MENDKAAPAASSSPAAPPAPRQTISISLSKKKKPKQQSTSAKLQLTTAEEEYSTVAQHAEVVSKKRAQEGNVLVIPCKQSRDEGKPLLAGRAAAASDETHHDVPSQSKPNNEDQEEEEATRQLIESATNRDDFEVKKTAGLTIAAPQQNTLNTKTAAETKSAATDDELFRRDLSVRADDVDPNSSTYANISIGDFGSALLRGMGWQGGVTKSKPKEEEIKARPHRLGLGATPLLPPPTGKHGRARRPEELKKEEERMRMEEEREKKRLEMERLDVQFTLQKNSIVKLSNRDRAKVIQTAGVPGLNRILVQLENGNEEAVNKSSVALSTWAELERDPFHHTKHGTNLNGGKERASSFSKHNSKSEEDQYIRRRKNGDYTVNSDEKKRSGNGSKHDRDSKRRHKDEDYSVDGSGYNRKRREPKRKDYGDDDSHYERKRRRKEESSRDKHSRRRDHGDERDNSRSKHKYRDREDERKDRGSKRSADHQEHLNWLLPNIRIRLVSKRYPRQHLNKGIVQDVISSQSNNSKAIILMDNQEVLDNIPERYLETALPKTGGNVIVLEGMHRWKKGRLLERSSEKGRGVIQLFEDLEVVEVSLDGIAEWCGQLDEDME